MHDAILKEAARTGKVLSANTYRFTAPLILDSVVGLQFEPGAILKPLNIVAGPIIHIQAMPPAHSVTGLPKRGLYSNFRVECDGIENLQYGIMVDGACLRFDNIEVINGYLGVVLGFSVDNIFNNLLCSRNACNIYVPGRGGWTVTTTHFNGANIREAESTGVLLQCGAGLSFNQTIIESNKGIGVAISPLAGSIIKPLKLRDTWFENNGTNVIGPEELISRDNVSNY